jgi:2-phospho-L-lactate guanylyltransferase (CobY/MobA/RfbA family)
MQCTAHIDVRMNQRGIRRELVNLALEFGEIHGDRHVLTSKIIDEQMSTLQSQMKVLADARKKGGVVVVAEGDVLITTYRANSFTAVHRKNK